VRVVLYHAGVVYESSGLMGSFWIFDDPSTSKLPGLLNVIIDIFVMPTLFFISGFSPRHRWSEKAHGGFSSPSSDE
jgi:hypothetical protein